MESSANKCLLCGELGCYREEEQALLQAQDSLPESHVPHQGWQVALHHPLWGRYIAAVCLKLGFS